jgi:hypothetical protein
MQLSGPRVKRIKDAGSEVCDSTRATEDAEPAPAIGPLS